MLDFQLDYEFENDYVSLRPLRGSDYDVLLRYALTEPDIWKFNAWGGGGAEGLRSYIATALRQRAAGREYPFIVFDKKTGEYAGSTRLYDIQPDRGCLQIGYTWYGKAYQGTMINKSCKYLLLRFAFETLGIERVGFGANAKNERSIAAMKSIGCTMEGILRSASLDREGRRIDIAVLSMLKEEWLERLKRRLEAKLAAYGASAS